MEKSPSGAVAPDQSDSGIMPLLRDDELVSLIYDTAFDPQLWPRLLETLNASLEQRLLHPSSQENDPHLELLLSHFERALGAVGRIYQMQAEHHVLRDFLNLFPVGVAIVQSNGAIVAMNGKADALVNSSPLLQIDNNMLAFPAHPDHMTRLQRAIRQTIANTEMPEPEEGSHALHLASNGHALSFWVTSVHDIAGISNPDFAAVLLTGADAAQQLNTDAVYQRYRLSPAERRLVDALLAGCDTLPEAARRLGVSHHTVRSQLRTICEKVGVSSKTELLKKILTAPEGLMADDSTRASALTAVPPGQGNPQPFHILTLTDGRHLEFTEYGPRDGMPLLYLHSTVHSRRRLHPFSRHVDNAGIHVIAPERPGYGRSDPPRGGSLQAYADDIEQLLDHLGIRSCHVVADGDGCPYALAAATRLADRIQRMALIASFAPPQFDKLERMVSLERLVHGINQFAPVFARHIVKMTLWGLQKNPEKYFDKIYHEMSAADQAVADMPEHIAIFAEQMENITPDNIDAYIDVYLARLSPWDFDIDAIDVPTDIWHGVEDRRTPVAFARKMAETIPDNRAFILDEQGHYLFYTHWDEVLKTLFDEPAA
jgi:pimeloyl-ACP methyl ester carboxylesterase/DNA-binding CsgD family transcriptional regulator/PAS domain-containing protein